VHPVDRFILNNPRRISHGRPKNPEFGEPKFLLDRRINIFGTFAQEEPEDPVIANSWEAAF
jgi:hypothetical protein